MKQERPYQKEAKEAVFYNLSQGIAKQIVSSATGTGKSFIAAKIASKFQKVLFIMHMEELISQNGIALLNEFYPEIPFTKAIEQNGGIVNYFRTISKNPLFASEEQINRFGIVKADLFNIDTKITLASYQTLHRRLDRIPKDHFDLIVIDECFPAGTMVDNTPIEKIKIGDIVKSFNHTINKIEFKKVVRLFKKEINADLLKIKLSNGTEFICTDNHPIYTKEHGYVSAKLLLNYICTEQMHCLYLKKNIKHEYSQKMEAVFFNINKDMQKMSKKIRPKTFFDKISHVLFKEMPKTINISKYKNILQYLQAMSRGIYKNSYQKTTSFLFRRLQSKNKKINLEASSSNLQDLSKTGNINWKRRVIKIKKRSTICLRFSNMQKKKPFNWREKSGDNQKKQWIREESFGKNEEKQSYVDARCKRKNDSIYEGKNIFKQGREWRTYETSINDAFSNRLRYGICYRNTYSKRIVSKFAKLLQSGFRCSRGEISNRNRWQNTQVEEMEVPRQEKNRDFEFVRVDSIEVHKRRSGIEYSEMPEKNYVYNIEVEDNHNYFVENTLVHNCHFCTSKSQLSIIQHFTPKLLLGLSATPYRISGIQLGDVFDKIVYSYPLDKAIKEGYLCELDAIQVKTRLDLDNVSTTAGELNQKDLKETVDTYERNQLLVNKYKEYADGKQCIVFCVNVEHAQNVNECFVDAGYKSEVFVGDEEITPDARAVIERMRKEETQILVSVNKGTTGLDIPNLQCGIMARPTKSLTLFMQSIGRLTRTLTGIIDGYETAEERIKAIKASAKPKAIIIDIVDVTSKHKLINTFELDRTKTIEEKTFISAERKEELIQRRDKAKFEATKIKDNKVNLFEIPTVEFSTSPKMRNPANDKQLNTLKNNGYDIVNENFTMGAASEIISNIPATKNQVDFLKWKKYNIRPGITYGEFKKALDEIKKREAKQVKPSQPLDLEVDF